MTESEQNKLAIADAMKRSARRDEICCRTGGDEFIVLAKHYDQEKESAYIRSVREQIDRRIREEGKPYRLRVSIGCYRSVPRGADEAIQNEAELFLKKADKAMYREKEGRQPEE